MCSAYNVRTIENSLFGNGQKCIVTFANHLILACHIQTLFLGLLGSITQTADSDDCPGKCIHAIASLICDEVIESVRQVHMHILCL